MQTGDVTTPFGRRPISLAHMTRQLTAKASVPKNTSIDKWKVFRHVSEARHRLGLQDRSLAVLNALLSFYPENKLSADAQLVVFPSNNQLSLRAHGIAGATLRRHLAILVESGLIFRRDSANGKRYARKDRAGEIESAFGFDLSPLLARADEFAAMADAVVADRLHLRRTKEELTICRRDVRKLLTAAIAEGTPGDWASMEARCTAILCALSRTASIGELTAILQQMNALRDDIVNHLDLLQNNENMSCNDAHDEHHIKVSESESHSDRKKLLKKAEGKSTPAERTAVIPLDMVLRACPQISDYGPGGKITSWRELTAAAALVSRMLDIGPSAYRAATDLLGAEGVAAVMACILEKSDSIQSAGGYLRNLTRRAQGGQFSPAPMVMALLKRHTDRGVLT